MTDLTDLSREIAVTSSAWDLPGVRIVDPETGAAWRRIGVTCLRWAADDDAAYIIGYAGVEFPRAHAAGPDLTDPVTVNALLGDGRVWEEGGQWHAYISWVVGPRSAPTRTEAICRAWVAAHKGEE